MKDGRIMLIPVEAVPRHQLWAWTPKTKQAVADSLVDPRPSAVVETAEQAAKVETARLLTKPSSPAAPEP